MLSPFGRTILYNGKDEQRFHKICSSLEKSGIRYKSTKYDYTSRLYYSSMLMPQSSATLGKHTIHMSTPSNYPIEAMDNKGFDFYAIEVRRRDLGRARKCVDV